MKQFSYNGVKISFSFKKGMMINATEMARVFNIKPGNWLRTEQSVRLIKALAASHKCDPTDLVVVKNGGTAFGTWMHEDVALAFAQWLSPEFYIWCNDHIKELMKHGATAVNPEDLLNPDYVISVMKALKHERAIKAQLQEQNKLQAQELKHSAPKVEYYEKVLDSRKLTATTVIAFDLGMSAIALNKLLKHRGIIRKVNGTWVLNSKYAGRGLAKTKTFPFTNSQGEVQTSKHLYWTEAGVEFIHNTIQQKITTL
jgi:phage antirepressor YoqD-like protein